MSTVGSVITVGTFDGVHRGHRAVLDEIALRAKRSSCRSVLVTFEPHPLEVVNPQAAPALLTVGVERREILAQSELDRVVFLPFTRTLSQYPPEDFVKLLLERYQLRELVIGHDHGFGRGRSGDVELLRELGAVLGFQVDVVEAVRYRDQPLSSTLVRRAVAGGDLDTATLLLGRRYSMVGQVVPGQGRGKALGFRTINILGADHRKLLPPDGVYAVEVEWRGGQAKGMMHQGPRPTFHETEPSVEVHLFDLDLDLYGAGVKVTWVQRLRDVIAFKGPEALRAQLELDKRAALAALTATPDTGSH